MSHEPHCVEHVSTDEYAEYLAFIAERAAAEADAARRHARITTLARTLQSPENSAPLAELLALLLEAP